MHVEWLALCDAAVHHPHGMRRLALGQVAAYVRPGVVQRFHVCVVGDEVQHGRGLQSMKTIHHIRFAHLRRYIAGACSRRCRGDPPPA
jgi:hypothetical protein